MQSISTIGLDIAKSVFQVHGVDAAGQVVLRRQLRRRYVLAFFQKLPPCLVGIEACASSHHWSRELQASGHTVRLMPPAYVKPYVKRQKNDTTDAEATLIEKVAEALATYHGDQPSEKYRRMVVAMLSKRIVRQASRRQPDARSSVRLGAIRGGCGSPSITRRGRGVSEVRYERDEAVELLPTT